MNCKYTLIINGEKKLFNSEQELDSFLSSYSENFVINEFDATLQTDAMKATTDKINSLTKKLSDIQVESVIINEDGDTETILKIPDSIGATRFIETFGNTKNWEKPIVTPFNKDQWLQNQREKLSQEGLSDEEIEIKLSNIQKSWKSLTDYGTDIHGLFEAIINETTYKPKLLTEEETEYISNDIRTWIASIKEKYGECQLITELPIVSDTIDEAFNKAGVKSINGRIDLLVIDKDGNAHIYDYKVSKKQVGNWNQTDNKKISNNEWSSSKKLKIENQMLIYKAILEQYGIRVKTINIVPIVIDPVYNEDLIDDISNCYIDTKSKVTISTNNEKWKNIITILPTKTLMDNVDLVTSIKEPMSKIVPNYEVETQVQRNNITIEEYKKKHDVVYRIKDGDNDRKLGKYKVRNNYKLNKWVYCNSEEEVNEAIKELVELENKNRNNELTELADLVVQTINGDISINDWDLDYSKFKTDYCKKIFRKYIDGQWELQNNPKYISAGIFIFTKNGLLEVVSLTHNLIKEEVNLGLGTTLLGASKQDFNVDRHKVLSATNGNIDLVKVMCLLNSLSPEIWNKYKINKISSFNIWMQEGCTTYNEKLYDNFNRLCKEYDIPLNLNLSNFSTTLEYTVNTIREVCGDELMSNIGDWTFTFSGNDIIEGVPFILDKMKELRTLPSAEGLRQALIKGEWNFDDPIQLSYMLLSNALNKLNGYEIYIETDPVNWVGIKAKGLHKGIFTGTNVNSPSNSPSLNVQTLSNIFTVANSQIKRKVLEKNLSYRKVFATLIKEKVNPIVGGEVSAYDNLFVKDENGKIDKRFQLKNPNDSSLSKAESEVIKKFLEIVNYYRFHNDENLINDAISNGTYYNVPLAVASTQSMMHNQGYKEVIKTKLDESVNFLRLLPEQQEKRIRENSSTRVYNKYELDGLNRETLLNKYGTEHFETNLNRLLDDFVITYSIQEVMNEYLPRLQGIKIALQFNQWMYGTINKDTIDYIDKYITINVHNQPIMDKNLQPIYKVLTTVRSVTTATALAWNFKSGIREMMQGMWMHISRSMANAYGKDQFTTKELAKSWTIIFKEAVKNINTLNIIDSLNLDYGMIDGDFYSMKKTLEVSSKYGIKNFDSDSLYIFNKIPDSYHRMGLLIAKMIHDGSWEAHKMVGDKLVYDFKKDKRFSLLTDPNSDKNSKEYKKQKGLYNTLLEQFNREGWNLKEGDDLPRAYTIQEGNSIKSFAEMCFGHYDKNTQMLCKFMMIGSFILQFRTFLSAKLEQWILKPGTYNQGSYQLQSDKNGNRYVRIYTFNEDGIPSVKLDTENNLKEEDTWDYYYEWNGRFMEGIFYTLGSIGTKLIKLDYQGLKEIWKSDTKRANVYLFLHDMIWLSILMWIIKSIWLSDKDNDLGPIGYTAASALYTSFSDGPITGILTSMFGDLNPPSYRIIKNLTKQTVDFISGEKNAFESIVNSFGALNVFKYYGQQLE